ncbi:hypothetical protein ACQWF4_23625, partial [Salmonella enterica subsp. enterica serovar Infantis]
LAGFILRIFFLLLLFGVFYVKNFVFVSPYMVNLSFFLIFWCLFSPVVFVFICGGFRVGFVWVVVVFNYFCLKKFVIAG